jgi:hypothetical protein
MEPIADEVMYAIVWLVVIALVVGFIIFTRETFREIRRMNRRGRGKRRLRTTLSPVRLIAKTSSDTPASRSDRPSTGNLASAP